MIDALLTEQERMLRSMLRNFVESELKPCVDEWDRRNELAYEAFEKMAGVGLTGGNISRERSFIPRYSCQCCQKLTARKIAI